MTLYRLYDGLSGRPGVGSSGTQPPAAETATTGGWLLGSMFSVTGQMAWLVGYDFWVPAGGDTGPHSFATWTRYSTSAQQLVPGSAVTASSLTAGAMNYVPLATPIQIAPAALYIAQVGWTVVNGIPVSSNQFGAAEPYAAGITSGILTGWSALTGSNKFPAAATNYNLGQNLFSNVLGADPTAAMANNGSGDDILWCGPVVSDTAPATYAGSYRLYPNKIDLGNFSLDTANGFTLGLQFSLTHDCQVNNAWFYSPAGVSVLPTATGFYRVSDKTLVAVNNSPSWSGAAASGWVSAPFTNVILQAGVNYKYVVFQGANSIWNAAVAGWWTTGGFGASGLTAGPVSCPNSAGADVSQNSYHQAGVISYPDTTAGPFEYGLDFEVTPLPPAVPAAAGGGRSMLGRALRWADL